MQACVFAFILFPAFLFAQENAEFVVKKSDAVKLFYSTENTGDPAALNFLVIGNNRICYYGGLLSPLEEYNLHGKAELPPDSTICYNYTVSKDSIKFVTYGKGNTAATGDYTYTDIYTFYYRGTKGVLRSDCLFSNNTRASWNWNYVEFIPAKKK